MIKIKYFGALASLLPEKDEEGFWILEKTDISIDEIISSTGVKETSINYLILVNNQRKNKDYILKDGDVLRLIPLFAGG